MWQNDHYGVHNCCRAHGFDVTRDHEQASFLVIWVVAIGCVSNAAAIFVRSGVWIHAPCSCSINFTQDYMLIPLYYEKRKVISSVADKLIPCNTRTRTGNTPWRMPQIQCHTHGMMHGLYQAELLSDADANLKWSIHKDPYDQYGLRRISKLYRYWFTTNEIPTFISLCLFVFGLICCICFKCVGVSGASGAHSWIHVMTDWYDNKPRLDLGWHCLFHDHLIQMRER